MRGKRNDKLFYDVYGTNTLKTFGFPLLEGIDVCPLCRGTRMRVCLNIGEYEEEHITYPCSCKKESK